MVLPFQIGGARVVIPGVYDTLRVQASLPAPVPAGRSILILGESEEGVPGSLLDLRLNYFTDFNSVRDYYKSGAIVDAARMAFTAQPAPVFGGAIQRLYVWKTNQTTRASKAIASPAGYGSIAASKYGEDGNTIRSQIKSLSEVKPVKTFKYLPSPTAQTLSVSVDGVVSSISLLAANIATGAGCATQVAALLNAVPGLSCSLAPVLSAIDSAVDGTISSTVGSDSITIVATVGAFDTAIAVGDVVVIPEGSALEGASGEFAGVYTVSSWSAASVTLKQVKQWAGGAEVNAAPLGAAFAFTGALNADLAGFAPITVEVTATTKTGSAASLEIASASGALVAARNLLDTAVAADMIRADDVSVSSLTAVASGASLVVTIANSIDSKGWSVVPQAGDIVSISRASAVAGALKANVGLYVVSASSVKSVTLQTISGIVPVSVAATTGSIATALEYLPSVVSTSVAPKKVSSASEYKVWIDAIDTKNNVVFPTTKIGGISYLEVGFNNGVDTSCTLSIDAFRVMTIVSTAMTLTVRLNKYKSLQNLADYLNTKTGLFAKVPNPLHKTLPTSVLDAVDGVAIMGAFSPLSANGKIKGDYYAFKKFLDDNFGLLSFAPGSLGLKAGLPAAESVAAYLTGAVVGATSDADVQQGMDEGIKIEVRNVVPLFSRDASDDVSDGLTDVDSSYSIDSIHAMTRNHVATASDIKTKRERFGMISIHESFAEAKIKCATLAYERLQMTFQMFRAVDGQGSIQWFLPWMGAMAVATGRSQASLGIPMLRKPFAFSNVQHIGKVSVYSDTLVQDFNPEDRGQLEDAISTGLLVFRAVTGFGVRMESPDLSTRSRENDAEGWVWERVNVLFTLDEVRATVRSVLENFIGARQTDVNTAVVTEAINSACAPFVSAGSLVGFKVNSVEKVGVGYKANLSLLPPEALEYIGVDVVAERSV